MGTGISVRVSHCVPDSRETRVPDRCLFMAGEHGVDGRNGLVTLAAYLAATVLISAAAFYGVFRYSLSNQLDDLKLEAAEGPPGSRDRSRFPGGVQTNPAVYRLECRTTAHSDARGIAVRKNGTLTREGGGV